MTKEIIGYMCKVDFEWELGQTQGGIYVYSSVEDLKECRKCVPECGIVEVKVTLSRVIEEGNATASTIKKALRDSFRSRFNC